MARMGGADDHKDKTQIDPQEGHQRLGGDRLCVQLQFTGIKGEGGIGRCAQMLIQLFRKPFGRLRILALDIDDALGWSQTGQQFIPDDQLHLEGVVRARRFQNRRRCQVGAAQDDLSFFLQHLLRHRLQPPLAGREGIRPIRQLQGGLPHSSIIRLYWLRGMNSRCCA